MTTKELINQYVTAHADNRWMDASELEALLTEFAGKLKEPASEDLEQAAEEYVTKEGYLAGLHYNSMVRSFKAGTQWQKEQMIKDAAKGQVERGYCEDGIPEYLEVFAYLNGRDERFKDLSDGQSVKVIIIKE